MFREIYHNLQQSSPVATIIISVAFMLFFGFLMTRITKKLRLPNVTAYIITGVLMGPYCLDLIPGQVIGGMDFLADIALAFIAFSTGQYFRFSAFGDPADTEAAAGLLCKLLGKAEMAEGASQK